MYLPINKVNTVSLCILVLLRVSSRFVYLTLCEMQCCSWKCQDICSFYYPHFMTLDMTDKGLLGYNNKVGS